MTGVTCMIAGIATSTSGGALDTQTVTTGGAGTAINQDRVRGFSLFGGFGTMVDGTSDIYGGATIFDFYWDEASASYYLAISGATNSGWTQVAIGGSKILTRASAFYGSGTWTWGTTDTITDQAFGSLNSVRSCVFT